MGSTLLLLAALSLPDGPWASQAAIPADGQGCCCRVYGAEVLLSALEACGVDNARIEVEGGGELPFWDGNAVGWAEEIQLAGLQVAPTLDGTMAGPREPLAPHKVSLPQSTHP